MEIGDRTSGGDLPRRPAMTAEEARTLGERELFDRLERLIVETRGNIAEVARRVGKDRSTVRYHLRRFGMLSGASPGEPPQRAHDRLHRD